MWLWCIAPRVRSEKGHYEVGILRAMRLVSYATARGSITQIRNSRATRMTRRNPQPLLARSGMDA